MMVEQLDPDDKALFDYLRMMHKSFGFPEQKDALLIPAMAKLRNKVPDQSKIRKIVDLILLHSLGKLGYHRYPQSIIGSVIPNGLQSICVIDTL